MNTTRKVSAPMNALDRLAMRGMYFGITRKQISTLLDGKGTNGLLSALDMLTGRINAIEWSVGPGNIPSVIDIALLSGSSMLKRVSFLVEAKQEHFMPTGFLFEDRFAGFVANLMVSPRAQSTSIITRLDRTIHFSYPIVQDFLSLRELLHPLTVRLEVQHYSWKDDDVRHILQRNKINVVSSHGPDLPGFSFGMNSYDERSAYFRFAGENKEAWFSGAVPKRQQWHYDSLTIDSIVSDIQCAVDEGGKEMICIMDTYPVRDALENLHDITERLCHFR